MNEPEEKKRKPERLSFNSEPSRIIIWLRHP
jgi:hypothetical protein